MPGKHRADAGCMICDTGHNVGGITYIVEQLKQQTYRQLHIIIGMVNDKDISGVPVSYTHLSSYCL